MQVLEAASVSDALGAVERHGVDVVLADINLGEHEPDGYVFVETLRRQGNRAKIVMVSGTPAVLETERARSRGADGYLELPVGEAEIMAVVGVLSA